MRLRKELKNLLLEVEGARAQCPVAGDVSAPCSPPSVFPSSWSRCWITWRNNAASRTRRSDGMLWTVINMPWGVQHIDDARLDRHDPICSTTERNATLHKQIGTNGLYVWLLTQSTMVNRDCRHVWPISSRCQAKASAAANVIMFPFQRYMYFSWWIMCCLTVDDLYKIMVN